MNSDRNVVITGLGVVAPNGNNVDEFYKNCIDGVTGIHQSDILKQFSYQSTYAGEVHLSEDLRWEAKHKKMGDIACEEMLKSAHMTKEDIEKLDSRVGFCMASANIGSLRLELQLRLKEGFNVDQANENIELLKKRGTDILDFNATDCSYYFADKLGIGGPVLTINTACASGTMAVGTAYRLIKSNQADVVVASGIETLSDLSLSGFNSMLNLSSKPCRPFDKGHDGITIGEGAAFVMLESEESAIKRGATILGRVFGYTTSNDAYHITSPDPTGKGALWCMQQTLNKRDSKVNEKLYVNTHGTATNANDSMELKALTELQENNSNIDHIWFSSTKSMVGHCLGASGIIEFVCSMKGLVEGKMPVSISAEDKMDFDESKITLVRNQSESVPYDYFISNSFAFAGCAASIGVEKWNEGEK